MRLLKALFALCLTIIISIAAMGYYNLNYVVYSGPETTFEVSSNEPFSTINYRLYKAGIISNPSVFYRYAKFKNQLTKMKTGKFLIQTGVNIPRVLDTLINGKSISTKVTIPEGKNIFEIGKILEANKIINYNDFVMHAKDRSLIEKLQIEGESAEGYLFPDTYFFDNGQKAESIITAMVTHFKNRTKEIDYFGDVNTSLSKYEILTLASIVEKETGAKTERPLIAGVFLNRIKKHMRLQSDPTTIYGLFDQFNGNFNGNLTKKNLEEFSPYNTYKINGLPKGPICNPGIEAINAVLNPAKHDAIYFVSQNDGTHIFSKNYKDHLAAVETFQKNRKNRVGKSWRNLKQ